MSTTAPSPCQTILTNLRQDADAFRRELADTQAQTQGPISLNLLKAQQSLFLALLSQNVSHSILAILPGSATAGKNRLKEISAWNKFLGYSSRWHLISSEPALQEQSGLVWTDLTRALHAFLNPKNPPADHFIIPQEAAAALQLPDKQLYQAASLHIVRHQSLRLSVFVESLVSQGYVRQSQSLEPGSFRVRGDNLQIRHPDLPGFIAISFFGKNIERIVHHVPPRSHSRTSITLPPLTLPKPSLTLAEITPGHTLVRPEHLASLQGKTTLTIDAVLPNLKFPWQAPPLQVPLEATKPWFVFYTNLDRTRARLAGNSSASSLCHQDLGRFSFALIAKDYIVTSEAYLCPSAPSASPISQTRALELISELMVGKPAVHTDHGIGMYEGLQPRLIGKWKRDYLMLRYAEGDSLAVPVEYAHKVTPYIGEGAPKIYRLGSTFWQKTRRQAQADAAEFAADLLKTAQARQSRQRPPYQIDPEIEQALHDTFPYTLTPDQERTWQEVQKDLTSASPADRLIVGDVGFGKTEIAIRAARHVIASGYQVALLAPTTLLVQQHYDTFRERLLDIAPEIALLSRFAPERLRAHVRREIEAGRVSLAIGTHALLNKSITWPRLGLVIIDEEHRFGVRQKEHFKKLRAVLDILSLSATPIPRTLSMALTGLRELSLITTAPQGRQAITTHVGPQNDDVIYQAIKSELARGGQVYVVAPKIRHLPHLTESIAALFPKATLAQAHGRLPGKSLEKIMHDFDAGTIQILVSSSIVENGLDLPNANTLIVTHATHFGLSDLYQLRGRIGRRDQQGHAYFFYTQNELTTPQRQRLTALTEAARLGSGWNLARRDLEIRGAGSLLGKEQSGTVNAVGVQMYLDMINQALHRSSLPRREVDVQLPLPAVLPTHYIADAAERTRWYQQLARAGDLATLHQSVQDLMRSFGPLPPEVEGLVALLTLQRLAAEHGITKISSRAISPPGEKTFQRLSLYADDLPRAVGQLAPLGPWHIKRDHATLDLGDLSRATVHKIITALQTGAQRSMAF